MTVMSLSKLSSPAKQTAVTRILSQWDELKTHFQIVGETEKCFYATQLYTCYKDDILKSYHLFIKPHLGNVQRINTNFQGSSDTDVTRLFNDICMLVEETANVITNKRKEDLKIPEPYLGYSFESQVSLLIASKSHTPDQINLVRTRCVQFICDLVYSLRKRLQSNITLLRQINIVSVEKALRTIKPSVAPLMKELGGDTTAITDAELKLKNLPILKWSNTSTTSSFWPEVDNFKDASIPSKK